MNDILEFTITISIDGVLTTVDAFVQNCPICHHTNDPNCGICRAIPGKVCIPCFVRGGPIAQGGGGSAGDPPPDPIAVP